MNGRDRLMQAASQHFRARSYAEVSVATILESSQLQAPSLYHHFGDKEGLYVLWAESAFQSLGSALAHDDADSFESALVRFGDRVAQGVQLDILRVMRDVPELGRQESRDRIYQAYLRHVFEPLLAVMLRGVESGRLRSEPIGRMATLFLVGALSRHPGLALPGASTPDDPQWWPDRFLQGFGPPGS